MTYSLLICLSGYRAGYGVNGLFVTQKNREMIPKSIISLQDLHHHSVDMQGMDKTIPAVPTPVVP